MTCHLIFKVSCEGFSWLIDSLSLLIINIPKLLRKKKTLLYTSVKINTSSGNKKFSGGDIMVF